MIVCQQCRSAVADGMRFCTECGAQISRVEGPPLAPTQRAGAGQTGAQERRVSRDDEKTLVVDTVPTLQDVHQAAPRFVAPIVPQQVVPILPADARPRSSRTALTVGVTAIATILLLALGAIGARFLFKEEESNRNAATTVKTRPTATPQTTVTPAVAVVTQPSATPAATVDASTVTREVTQTLNDWVAATKAHNLDQHMSFYADTLAVYYGRSNVSAAVVRADRSRAYARFYKLDMELDKIEVTPDAAMQRATAAFDKTYEFEGEDKTMSGSVRQMLWLAKINGRWRIIGEKDLKVYYAND